MILIFFNTICVIIYFKKSKNYVRKYIFNILNLYIQTQKTKNEPPKKRNLNRDSKNSKERYIVCVRWNFIKESIIEFKANLGRDLIPVNNK